MQQVLHLVIALEEVVEVVPLSNQDTCRVQPMAAGLLEVALPLAQQFANCLHNRSIVLVRESNDIAWYSLNKVMTFLHKHCQAAKLLLSVLAA